MASFPQSPQGYQPSVPDVYEFDKIAGILTAVIGGLTCLGGLVAVAFMGIFTTLAVSQSHSSATGSAFLGIGFAGFILLMLCATGVAYIFVGMGMAKGKRSAFVAALIFGALSLHTFVGILLLVYAIVRLTGSYGPKPI